MTLGTSLAGDRVRLEANGIGGYRIVRLADEKAVGEVALEAGDETVTIRRLCIDEGERGYGCGSETGYLLVRAAHASSYRCLRAWAPPHLGLAVYYWFRMGFHPLHGEGPEGGIWLERDVSSPL